MRQRLGRFSGPTARPQTSLGQRPTAIKLRVCVTSDDSSRTLCAQASWSAAVPPFHYPQFLGRACKPERLPLFVILSGVFAAKDPAWQFESAQWRDVCGGCQRAATQLRDKLFTFERFGVYWEVPSTDSGQALRFEDFAQDDTLLSADFSLYAPCAKMWVMERVPRRFHSRTEVQVPRKLVPRATVYETEFRRQVRSQTEFGNERGERGNAREFLNLMAMGQRPRLVCGRAVGAEQMLGMIRAQ